LYRILNDAEAAEAVINRAFEIEILQHKIEELCIIALVGENMKNHQGLSGKMFSTLGKTMSISIAQGASEETYQR
jgi:aspartokinase/homoserine dehydrogenase 1